MEHLFVDGLGSLSVSSGIVRIELCVQAKAPNQQDKKNDEAPATILVPTCSVNMPVQNFANMMGQLQGLVDKLEKDGKLKRQPAVPSGSPNFN